MYEQAKHECGVRFLCYLRHKKGLTWFRKYVSDSPNIHYLFNDFVEQYAKGNRGEIGCWKK